MTPTLSAASFASHLYSIFIAHATEALSLEFELAEVAERPSAPGQVLFTLQFRGPLEYLLQQGTYRLEHDQLGVLDVFLVPVSKQADGYRYEVVFNLLTSPDGQGGTADE